MNIEGTLFLGDDRECTMRNPIFVKSYDSDWIGASESHTRSFSPMW